MDENGADFSEANLSHFCRSTRFPSSFSMFFARRSDHVEPTLGKWMSDAAGPPAQRRAPTAIIRPARLCSMALDVDTRDHFYKTFARRSDADTNVFDPIKKCGICKGPAFKGGEPPVMVYMETGRFGYLNEGRYGFLNWICCKTCRDGAKKYRKAHPEMRPRGAGGGGG